MDSSGFSDQMQTQKLWREFSLKTAFSVSPEDKCPNLAPLKAGRFWVLTRETAADGVTSPLSGDIGLVSYLFTFSGSIWM